MTETQLVRSCIEYLNMKGHYVWRNNTGATRLSYTDKKGNISNRILRSGIRGSSDILGISKDGMFIAIECKVGRNKPTEMQINFLRQITDRGGIAQVVYTLDDLIISTNL